MLDLEHRDWMTKIRAVCRERDKRIEDLRRDSFSRANPEAALDLSSRPVRLEALRNMVRSRLELREEYARRQSELLSEDALTALRVDLERFVENAAKNDQRSRPEAGDILAELRVGVDKLALLRPAPKLPGATTNLRPASQVLIAYSWDSDEHKRWVLALATKLRTEGGIEVILDQWHLDLGARSPEFMERAVRDSDCVLVICTEGYKHRFDNRTGGAGYEGHIITGEIVNEVGKNKFIPILRQGDWRSSIPTALAGVHGADLRQDSPTEYGRLLDHLRGVKHVPSVGIRPEARETAEENRLAPAEPSEDDPSLSQDDLALLIEKRGAYLVVWLTNETLDPVENCSITLTSLQQYDEKRNDFRRNPFNPVVLIPAHAINAGADSKEAAALVRCSDVQNTCLTISNSGIEIKTGGIWLVDLIVQGGNQRREERLFFEWTPGAQPKFTNDPRH